MITSNTTINLLVSRKKFIEELHTTTKKSRRKLGAAENIKHIFGNEYRFIDGINHEIDTVEDPLNFPGYKEKVSKDREITGLLDSTLTAIGRMGDQEVVVCSMDARFRMGSMGIDVGERITRSFELAIEKRLPIIVFTASGGARMQEGVFSLMQMAKTIQAVNAHHEAGLLYICVMLNPTMGGVTASFASVADIIIGEEDATIGFSGSRVIKESIREELPENFQKAYFMEESGLLDCVCSYEDLPSLLRTLIGLHSQSDSKEVDNETN